MNDKPSKTRKAGERVFKPTLKLLRPQAECSTASPIFDAPREVKEMLRDMNQKRLVVKENDAPEAA